MVVVVVVEEEDYLYRMRVTLAASLVPCQMVLIIAYVSTLGLN